MKNSRYTEDQIAYAFRQGETGTRVAEICRQMGISDATFYNWKKKSGGLGVQEILKKGLRAKQKRVFMDCLHDTCQASARLQSKDGNHL